MRVRVGVRTAVSKGMCSFYSEALEGDRRVGVRCRPLRHGPMTSLLRQGVERNALLSLSANRW